MIEKVGEKNIIQIIIDNGSNYINTSKRLMEKKNRIYWTPYAAHYINLILENIEKLKIHQSTLVKAKQIVKFIYKHTWVLALMRYFIKDRDLLHPTITRFVGFLTLQNIYKQKQPLQSILSSKAWCSSKWVRNTKKIKARATMLFDPHCSDHLAYCIEIVIPHVNVLSKVDLQKKR